MKDEKKNIRAYRRAGGIRTHDLLNPIQAHYQAVLRPVIWREYRSPENQRKPALLEARASARPKENKNA